MNRSEYLLDKLAEEAAEVAQAAIKHKHKRTKKSRRRLANEVGDLLGVLSVLQLTIELDLVQIGIVTKMRAGVTNRTAKELKA